ncbi:MAG: tetratricopeptide repeat protein [Candidatus Aquirickettsiella sp.]
MKNLTLIRHADTHLQQFLESDEDRVITQLGHHQIEDIAKQLKEKKCLPDYLLCSPAKRAVQTAQLLCERLEIDPKFINISPVLYMGTIQNILQSLFLLNLSKQAFIIGHNPTLSCLAHRLCMITNSITLPTAGVISLSFDIISWDDLLTGQGKLLFFIKPSTNDLGFSLDNSLFNNVNCEQPSPLNSNQIPISSNKIEQLPPSAKPSIEEFFQQALKAHEMGEVKYARDIYEYILNIQPDHVETMHALGMLAIELQQWETAVVWIQKALSIQPNSARFHLHLANVFKTINQFEFALTHYQAALRLDPEYAEVHNNLAGLFYKQNQLNAALQHYKQALDLKPDYLEAHFNLGLVFLAHQEKNAAITQFKNVLRLHPDSIQGHWQLANIYWQDQDLEKVHYHYQKILDLNPNSVELLNNFAALMLKKETPDVAIEYFKRALTIDPKHKTARNNLAAILLQTNQLKEAIWHYTLYLNLEPLDTEALFNRAHSLMLSGHLHEASHDLKKILTINDKQIDAHCNLAAIYLKLNDHTAALMHYQTILNVTNKHAIANYMVSALTQESIPDRAPLEYIKNLFDNYAFQFDAHLQNILLYKTPELLRKQLNPFLEKKKYNLLDLGCGTGLSGKSFIDISRKITGIDISRNMLIKAKEKGYYNILIEKDILNGIAELECFDLILCIDALVYFGSLNEFFNRITLCLADNGLLAFSIELADETISTYTLQANGRYQHAEIYVRKLAEKNQLKLLKYANVVGRHQDGEAINTGLFIFHKK